MINQKDLEEILLQNKILTEKQIKETKNKAKKLGKIFEEYLLEQKIISPELLYETAAKYYDLPFIELKNKTIRKDILEIVPEITAQAHQTVAFDKNKKELLVATLDISNIELFDFLGKKTQLEIKIHITSPKDIQEVLKQYHKGLSAEFEEMEKDSQADENEKPENLKTLAQDLPIVRIVDTLLEYAILEKASDIHIEPSEKEVTVRYRIDGVLRNVMTLPKNTHAGVVARIKILSSLKLDEHRLPQDGRFKIKTDTYQVSFRVSILPTFDGEKVVMRLLPEQNNQLSLEQLGLQKQSLEIVRRNIEKPHGMILVTGPTGSGKTTTLYTILAALNKPAVNISTIEDPIEYRMNGITQSQIQPKIGFTFATGLRALLRQDPDIIMVGEIRDTETAEIAINAAMTGHLVLSTLHTNDAVTTIPRFIDMKIPTFLIASTVNVIVAQRLVRKICKNCIESFNLDKKTIDELEQQFNLKKMEKNLSDHGYLDKKQTIESILFYRGKGCQQCDNTGYKGRLGIYETLEVDEEISQMIVQKASRDELAQKATDKGMMTLLQDGFIKAKNGITTIEEVLRVTQE
ncbi:MAG TPA: ATPase, T2SS/T4P/T4SS family [bacterium]|nr:ATPase, T2SS/T4P/T4SS family [bacterium]HNS33844.1 ATPase, T2SS/T4P/T4SS family [bacterium]HOH67455.1 ATPase, T2SS/T4P/T4SS family [bacterium]